MPPRAPRRRNGRSPARIGTSSPANKSLRGSRGPEAGVRGLPSPFIKIYERGRETPHPSLLPLVPQRKDFLDEMLVNQTAIRAGLSALDGQQGPMELEQQVFGG